MDPPRLDEEEYKMKIAKIVGRDMPERVDVEFTNVEGATITLGYAVHFVTTNSSSNDGREAVLSDALPAPRSFAGIALSDVADNGVGKARIFGHCNSVHVFATGTSVTVAAGEPMGPGVAGSLGVNSTGLVTAFGPVLALEAAGAAVCSPGGYVKGFVRAL